MSEAFFVSTRRLYLGAAWLYLRERFFVNPRDAVAQAARLAWIGLTSRA